MCSQDSRHFTRRSFLVAVSKYANVKVFSFEHGSRWQKIHRHHHNHLLLQFYHIIIFVWLFMPAPHAVARFLDNTSPGEGVLL